MKQPKKLGEHTGHFMTTQTETIVYEKDEQGYTHIAIMIKRGGTITKKEVKYRNCTQNEDSTIQFEYTEVDITAANPRRKTHNFAIPKALVEIFIEQLKITQ